MAPVAASFMEGGWLASLTLRASQASMPGTEGPRSCCFMVMSVTQEGGVAGTLQGGQAESVASGPHSPLEPSGESPLEWGRRWEPPPRMPTTRHLSSVIFKLFVYTQMNTEEPFSHPLVQLLQSITW